MQVKERGLIEKRLSSSQETEKKKGEMKNGMPDEDPTARRDELDVLLYS